MFTNFKTVFISESLKKKYTGIYLLGFILGVFSPIILFIFRIIGSTRRIPNFPHNLHINFIDNSLELFAYYMLPFLIILTASRISQLDHRNKGWKLMESLPVKKYEVYFSKFTILLITNSISIVTFVLFGLFFVYLLNLFGIISEMGSIKVPYVFCFHLMLRLFVASLFLSSLQFAISVLIANFLWPITIGTLGFLLSTYFNEFGIFMSWYPYSPISACFQFSMGSEVGNVFTYINYISLTASILILYVGYQWFKNKSLRLLFILKNKMLLKTVSVFIVFVGLFVLLKTPRKMSAHNRTVLQGVIASDISVNSVELVDVSSRDTLLNIPVKNNRFKMICKDSIIPKNYILSVDKKFKTNLFFGTNDSIDINVDIKLNQSAFSIKGTRLGENKIENEKYNADWFTEMMLNRMLKDSSYYKTPSLFLKEIDKGWCKNINQLTSFKTIDNYILREDFIEYKKANLTRKYRKYLNDFRAKARENDPDFDLKLPLDLEHLNEPKITIQEAVEDLEEFCAILDNKSSYSQFFDSNYQDEIKSLRNKLLMLNERTISTSEFANEIAKIMAQIGDRHSSVRDMEMNPKKYKTYDLCLPFGIVAYKSNFIALKKQAYTYNYRYLYKNYPYVKSINGITIDAFVNRYAYKNKKAPLASKLSCATKEIQQIGALLFKNNLKCTDSVQVVFSNGIKEIQESFKLEKENKGFMPKLRVHNYYNSRFLRRKQFGELSRIIDKNIGYINIPLMCHYKDIPELEEFLNDRMKYFSNTKALVIDIRNNLGGGREILQTFSKYIVPKSNSPWVANVAFLRTKDRFMKEDASMEGRYLFSYYSKNFNNEDRKAIDRFNENFKIQGEIDSLQFSQPFYMVLHTGKIQYTNPVYILINEESFSAASVFASAFKGLPNVKIVGVTTDGSSGNSKKVYLKNSNIRIKVSTMLSFQRNGKTLDGNGTEPDIYIPADLKQIFTGRDTQLEKLIKKIN